MQARRVRFRVSHKVSMVRVVVIGPTLDSPGVLIVWPKMTTFGTKLGPDLQNILRFM